MTDDPVELDGYRGMAAQQQMKARRPHLDRFQAEQEAMRLRQEELESLLIAAPAETWTEVPARRHNIIQLFAGTQQAQNKRRKQRVCAN